MNMLNTKFTFPAKIIGLFYLAAVSLMSCSKNDGNGAVPVIPSAFISISHASPSAPAYDFLANGTKVTQKALEFGKTLTYNRFWAGSRDFSITQKDGTDTLVRSTMEIKKNRAYTIFISDIPAKVAFVLIDDDLSAPAADKAKIRFVNMSPDAGDLDLIVTGKATPLFTKTAFKGSTAFSAIDPGTEVNFEITESAGITALATLPKVKIEKGRIYTVWAKGLKGATDGTKLAASLIVNK
jgi:hypothetical protein